MGFLESGVGIWVEERGIEGSEVHLLERQKRHQNVYN